MSRRKWCKRKSFVTNRWKTLYTFVNTYYARKHAVIFRSFGASLFIVSNEKDLTDQIKEKVNLKKGKCHRNRS